MPPPPIPVMRRPRFTTLDLFRLMDTYVRAGDEIIGRPWRLTADAARRSASLVEQGLLGPWSAANVLSGLGTEYVNLLANLATAVPTAIENIANRLDNPPAGLLSDYQVPIAGADPEEIGTMFEVGPDRTVPFTLPARVIDASQGWAAWYVDKAAIAALLDAPTAAAFEPLDCGGGRSMVMLLGIDFRVSDFGRYRELQLAVSVTPKESAAEPGAVYVRIIVSEAFSVEPGKRAWGFDKDVFTQLPVRYRQDHVVFHTGNDTPDDFALRLPRLGNGRSVDVPVVIYSIRNPDSADAIAGPVRIVLNRSGSGEAAQIGGSVALRLGNPDQKNCFCSAPGVACLCTTLRTLKLDQTLPAANGWTERMTGTLEAPSPLALQPG
jgi:hypothetical protein